MTEFKILEMQTLDFTIIDKIWFASNLTRGNSIC